MIVLGFNDMSTLVGHFESSPREREKRDRIDSRGDEREGQGRKRKMNECDETEEIKTFPHYRYLLQEQQALPLTVSQYQVDALVTQDTRHFCLPQPPPKKSKQTMTDSKKVRHYENKPIQIY